MPISDVYPVILSGGSGTRLWPLSRAMYPKQFIRFFSGQSSSFLAAALTRLGQDLSFRPPILLCNNDHRFLVREEVVLVYLDRLVLLDQNAVDIPVGPILSMKEIAEEPSLRETGTVVEVDHPTRGKYLTVGNPIKLSDSPCEVQRSPLLGEHTDEILKVLGYSASDIAEIKGSGAITPAEKGARAEAA